MDTLLGIFFLAVIIGLVLLWNKGKDAVSDRAAAALNRRVQPRRFEQGQRETQESVHFTVKLSPDEFLHAMRQRLDMAEGSSVTSRLYPVAHAGDGFDILCGTKLQTWFRYRIVLDPAADGCQGEAGVAEWHKSEGMVVKFEEMTRIRKALIAVAEENHGTVKGSVSQKGTTS